MLFRLDGNSISDIVESLKICPYMFVIPVNKENSLNVLITLLAWNTLVPIGLHYPPTMFRVLVKKIRKSAYVLTSNISQTPRDIII